MQNTAIRCNKGSANNCNDCRLSSICLPISLQIEDINQLDNIIKRGRILQKGQTLFEKNDTFTSIYAVRSGSLKTFTRNDTGEEQITGFYLPGEILGLDGLASEQYSNVALALETTNVCEIPFSNLEDLCLKLPSVQKRFFQIMGKEIKQDHELISLLSKKSADQKIASLFISISMRNESRHLSSLNFILPMSRSDIGNYLGLTIETVSRAITRLVKNHIIEIDKKNVNIKDINALKALASD